MQGNYTPEFVARFWARVEKSDGCWVWIGARTTAGYGETWQGRVLYTHRVAYELTIGPIPADLHVLHRCDNPPCCRPDHLFAGTHADNMRDMFAKGRGPKLWQRPRGDRNGRRLHPERYINVRPKPMPGEQNPRAKLTEADVIEIRRAYAAGEAKQAELGRLFNVSQAKISQIVLRRVWKHLP